MGNIMNIRQVREAKAIEEWIAMKAMHDDSFDTQTINSFPEGVHHIVEDAPYEELMVETHEACVRAEMVKRLERGLSKRTKANSVMGLAALPYVQTLTGGLTHRRKQGGLHINVLTPKVNEPTYESEMDIMYEKPFVVSPTHTHHKDIDPKSNLHHHSTDIRYHVRQRRRAKQTARLSIS